MWRSEAQFEVMSSLLADASLARMFRSLRSFNYRLWAAGALVSNIGTWMQRIGQDWLVLTVLTDHNATAVGWVMALQFGPPLLLLPLTGYAADSDFGYTCDTQGGSSGSPRAARSG